MTRIAALNDWSLGSSEEDAGPTREALEAHATKYYNEAINYLAHGNDERAHQHFCQVLLNPYVEKANWPEGEQPQRSLPQDVALKYSCLKNLGNLAAKRGDYERAVKHYLEAVQLDNTEVILWQRLGATAIKLRDFELALVAFQEGLTVNPNHWPCMDQLMSVLFILEMYMDCLGLAITALRQDSSYVKANAFKEKIFELQPSLIEDAKAFFSDSSILFRTVDYDRAKGDKFIATCESLRPAPKAPRAASPLPNQRLRASLQRLTWENLVHALISTYDTLVEADGMEFAAKIDVHDALKLREETKADEARTSDSNKETATQEEAERSSRDETVKNSDGTESSKQKQGGGGGGGGGSSSSDECRTAGNKTPSSEGRQEASAADLSENSLTPRKISGRRHTIELGESQDSFRVGEKRRSLDSDTQHTPDDDLKAEESASKAGDTAGKEGDVSEAKKLCPGNEEGQKEEGSGVDVNVSVPSVSEDKGVTRASESPAVVEGDVVDASTNEKNASVKANAENTTSPPPPPPPPPPSKQPADSMDKTDDVAAAEKDSTQTSLPKPADDTEKTETEAAKDNEKVKEAQHRSRIPENPPLPPDEPQIEMCDVANIPLPDDTDKPTATQNTTVDQPEPEKEKEGETQQELNTEKSQVEKEPEERESNLEAKEGSSNVDSGYKEKEGSADEENMVVGRPETEAFCEEEEEEEGRQTEEEPLEENRIVATEEGMEEEEREEEVDETMPMEVQGMLEEEGVTETEEAVNTLKGIMALQPTEILGLPEPDEFDYGGEYVEYFEGGVYEEEELENMNNDGTYAEGEEEEEEEERERA